MKKYIIVEGSIETQKSLDKFKEGVNDKLAEGYMPIGSPIVAGIWIAQTMLYDRSRYYISNPNPLG